MVWGLLAAITLSWPALLLQRARRQKEAVQAIRSSGGVAVYRWGEPVPPNPDGIRNTIYPSEFPPPFHDELRDWLGIDLVDDVIEAGIKHKEHSRYLDAFPRLELLGFPGKQADDTVLEPIGHLKELKFLGLRNSQVTDAGLRHLEGLRQLEVINLENTRVTREGVERLQKALPKARIDY